MKDDATIVKECIQRYEAAEQKRREVSPVLEQLAKYARPAVENVSGEASTGVTGNKDATRSTRLFDTTLMRAVNDYGAGIKAWMSPANSRWFSATPHEMYGHDEEVHKWHQKVTEIMEREQNATGFHAEDFEAVIDGGAFGTRALMITETSNPERPFSTKRYEPGRFSIMENAEREVDQVYFTEQFTPEQAKGKFGEDALPDAVKGRLAGSKANPQEDVYVLCIYPRDPDEYDANMLGGENMPIASNWIHLNSKTLVRKSGFPEFPAVISRRLRWSNTPWGRSAAIDALADARQLNALQCDLDLLAAIAANPRLLLPVEFEGNVNLQPGGPTYYTAPDRMPKTWGTEGSSIEGQERVRMRQKHIEDALHLDVFKTFRRITKEITATEAMAIQNEAIDLFSPEYSLMATEHYTKVLNRQFLIMLRAGRFPEVPKKMQIQMDDGSTEIMPPQIVFSSRIALAITNRNREAIMQDIQRRVELSNIIGPSALDGMDIVKALNMVSRGNGVPEDVLRTEEQIAEIQAARAEAEATQAQAAQMEQLASAAGKIKGSKAEDELLARADAAT